ncbi:MAG: glycine--tRNA ligase [Candidatus Woesearchaeota archaeon]
MKNQKKIGIEDIYIFCKKKGFVFPNSEIYGGISGFYDYGPLGVEIINSIKSIWWQEHVHRRDDIVGIYGTIITNPRVWVASNHVQKFSDLLVKCPKCKQAFRADHLVEEKTGIKTENLSSKEIQKIIEEKNIRCPNCGSKLSSVENFNLMFKTFIGVLESGESIAYLRPETAQVIFSDFKLVQETSRKKLPFGIAQIGKAFRNEISPRNFLFRCREFEQAEIEYFIREKDLNNCPFYEEFENYKVLVLSSEAQKNNKNHEMMSLGNCFKKGIINSKWTAYWLGFEHNFLVNLGISPERLRLRQHLPEERAHYSLDTWDIEYEFPFGWKEIEGIANRTTYDLNCHIKESGKDLSYYDEDSKEKIIPYVVAEPSLGIERLFLALLFEAYNYDAERENIVLNLKPKIAPYKAAVFPLLSNNKELVVLSEKVCKELRESFNVFYDKSGSIGRRYARQDEIGTPYCITVDFDSLKNKDVTIRDRRTTKQKRVKIEELTSCLRKLIDEEIDFEEI